MSILSRKRKAPAGSTATPAAQPTPAPSGTGSTDPVSGTGSTGPVSGTGSTGPVSGTASTGPVSGTRTSAAWLGVCLAAVLLVVLIVFLLQNTNSVEVTFLWMHGRLPLAIALLIAGVGAALLTMIVGVARITQLRRRFRRDHRAPSGPAQD
jgi:uncharacterized integral membrane protein